MKNSVLCSSCFQNQGLKFACMMHGKRDATVCPNCRETTGVKMTQSQLKAVAYDFFVEGTNPRKDFVDAPIIHFNSSQSPDQVSLLWLESDMRLIEKVLAIGFFYYGPAAWHTGEIEPLNDLLNAQTRGAVIQRILATYPSFVLTPEEEFFRLRKFSGGGGPLCDSEYDSPPDSLGQEHRLYSEGLPVMYGSQDLEICVSECEVSPGDDSYFATISPVVPLKILDLTAILPSEAYNPHASLDLAVRKLFCAGTQYYDICAAIGTATAAAGHDGLAFPSFYSSLITGAEPFETRYGIALRMLSSYAPYERLKIIPNFAIFGRPIRDKRVIVKCINRVSVARIKYHLRCGPVL